VSVGAVRVGAMERIEIPLASGLAVSARVWGDVQPPPFVLVHGLASNARLWDAVAEELNAEGHPVVAIDLPGHGETPLPADGVDTASAAATVAEVMRTMSLRGAIVAGQSWGGNVVVRLAAEEPDLVGALALVDGGWIDLAADFDSWEECAAALTPPAVDGLSKVALLGYLRKAHPDWSAGAIEATAANLRERPDGTVERRLPIPDHMRIVRDMWDNPPEAWLPRIEAETLLLPALAPDDPARVERTRARVAAAASLLRKSRVREYPDSDHDLHAQRPLLVAVDMLGLVV
jgi:pimeloyl-ACP methyl ester carboxylesterase